MEELKHEASSLRQEVKRLLNEARAEQGIFRQTTPVSSPALLGSPSDHGSPAMSMTSTPTRGGSADAMAQFHIALARLVESGRVPAAVPSSFYDLAVKLGTPRRRAYGQVRKVRGQDLWETPDKKRFRKQYLAYRHLRSRRDQERQQQHAELTRFLSQHPELRTMVLEQMVRDSEAKTGSAPTEAGPFPEGGRAADRSPRSRSPSRARDSDDGGSGAGSTMRSAWLGKYVSLPVAPLDFAVDSGAGDGGSRFGFGLDGANSRTPATEDEDAMAGPGCSITPRPDARPLLGRFVSVRGLPASQSLYPLVRLWATGQLALGAREACVQRSLHDSSHGGTPSQTLGDSKVPSDCEDEAAPASGERGDDLAGMKQEVAATSDYISVYCADANGDANIGPVLDTCQDAFLRGRQAARLDCTHAFRVADVARPDAAPADLLAEYTQRFRVFKRRLVKGP